MTATAKVECPYVGLVPFTEADARFFFGRENDQAVVIANLFASRLTVLYGASGVGKSSLLRAGAMRELLRRAGGGAENGAAELQVVYFKEWQDQPLDRLVREIRRVTGGGESAAGGGASLAGVLTEAVRRFNGDIMVLLDQFEDYFKYPDTGPRTFVAEFAEAVHRSGLSVSFLLSLRDDALSRLDRFKTLIPNLLANTLRLEPLDREQAAQAIVRPVEAYGALPPQERAHPGSFSVEPALVDAVLDEVRRGQVLIGDVGRGQAKGAQATSVEAPYLQLVMTRVWMEEVRVGSARLRASTLRQLGGAERIVQSHLDDVMGALSIRERKVGARIFEHLVTPTGNKIAHTASDLAGYASVPPKEVEDLLARLSGSAMRILTPVAAPAGQEGGSHYEIYHDALGPAVLDWRRRHAAKRATWRRLARWLPVAVTIAGLLLSWGVFQSWSAREARRHAAQLEVERERARNAEEGARREADRAADAEARVARMAQDLALAAGNSEEAARFKSIAEKAARQKEQLAARIDERADSMDTLARENGRLKIQLDQARAELAKLQVGLKTPASEAPPRTLTLGLRLRNLYVVQDGTGARTRWTFSVRANDAEVLTIPEDAYNDKDPQPLRLQQSARIDVREGGAVKLEVQGRSEERNTAVGQQTIVIPRLSDLVVSQTKGSSAGAIGVELPVFVRDGAKQGSFVLSLDLDLLPPRAAK